MSLFVQLAAVVAKMETTASPARSPDAKMFFKCLAIAAHPKQFGLGLLGEPGRFILKTIMIKTPRRLITFTAIRPVLGLPKGLEVSLLRVALVS